MTPDNRDTAGPGCPLVHCQKGMAAAARQNDDTCPSRCRHLYARLSARLAVPCPAPARPPRDEPCDLNTLLHDQAQWLERSIVQERERGRSGSWVHDGHRLAALRQLHAMALCQAHRPDPGAKPRNGKSPADV
ncbi:hypothetical protein SAMN05428979_0916 [Stappia sp. ES.058]|nr:hypothetical protein SAMN05428979_0916 [Stappia sp. ES.058]